MKESLKSIMGAFPNLEVLNTSSTDTMRSRAYSAVDMEYFNDGHESSRIAQQRYESISKIHWEDILLEVQDPHLVKTLIADLIYDI